MEAPKSPSMLYVCLGVICLAVLFMPLQGETNSFLADYVTLDISHKLIACYVLGKRHNVI